jgi:hypothetical protein
VTITAIFLAAASLFGNEHEEPAAHHSAAKAVSPAQTAAPESVANPHSEKKPPEPHPPEHAQKTTEENHVDPPAPSHQAPSATDHEVEAAHSTSAKVGHEKSGHATEKTTSKAHMEPSPPKRPNGVLCGVLPAKKMVWKAKKGPLSLVGTVVIGPGAELRIEPGTEIRIGAFDSCPDSGMATNDGRTIALILRGGKLRLEGKPGKPIRFLPTGTGKGYLWNGIRIEKAARDDDAVLRWIEVPRATKGVSFLAGSGILQHAVIEDCGIGVTSLLGASPSISHSIIARSGITGIASNRSATRVVSSLILEGGDGIRFDGVGLSSVATSCFWGQSGTEIVRGPKGLGDWKGDSLADRFGNWNRDPVLQGSSEHERKLVEARKKMEAQPWWKPRRLPENPFGQGSWTLSPFSPLIDKGETRFCSDPDGSKCDIGLWGGP